MMPRPRSREARQKVLDSTTALIVEGGLAAVNYDAVAARSGVAKTTIYRHWPERESLLFDAVSDHFADPTPPDTGTLRGDLVEFFRRARREEFGGPRRDLFACIIDAAPRDAGMEALAQRLFEGRRRTVAGIIERARQRGELTTELDEETVHGVIVGPLVFQRVVRRMPVTDRYITGCIDVVLAGLGVHDEGGTRQRAETSNRVPVVRPTPDS